MADVLLRNLGVDFWDVIASTAKYKRMMSEGMAVGEVFELFRMDILNNKVPPVDSFECIRAVCSRFEHFQIVSAAESEEEKRLALQWLDNNRFWEQVDRPPAISFCGPKSRDKADKIRTLSSRPDIFLDDRDDYLHHMIELVPFPVLFDRGGSANPDGLLVVQSWNEFARLVPSLG